MARGAVAMAAAPPLDRSPARPLRPLDDVCHPKFTLERKRKTKNARAMEPEDDALVVELELLQAMYTVEEDELCITTAPGSTEVAMRLRPQTGGERAQRFMEVVLQLRCGDKYPSEAAPTIRLHRARGFVEDEEAQLLCGVHARAAELQGKHCPCLYA